MFYKNPYVELCFEGSFSMLKDLPEKDKEFLVQDHTFSLLKKGELVFHEGDKPSGLYCLALGKVKIFK